MGVKRYIILLFLFGFSIHDYAQNPNAGFIINDSTVCERTIVWFANTSTGTAPLTYNWDFGGQGTSVIKDPSWTFTNPGVFSVTLTVTNSLGNSDSKSKSITVYASPNAGFSIDDNIGCKNHQVCFTNTSTIGDAPLNTYQWIFGDGGMSSQENPCHIYNIPTTATGQYTVFFTVIDQNGCADKDTLVKGITVFDKPKANFNSVPAISCTIPANIQFNDVSLIADTGSSPLASWTWNFGDTQTGTTQSPLHIYNTAGIYPVKLIITDQNSCKDSITKTIVADDFKINISTLDTEGCSPFGVTFTGSYYSVLGTNGKPIVWVWSFAGGVPGSQVTSTLSNQTTTTSNIKFTTPGNHIVTVTATNAYNCQATATKTVIVHPIPVISFLADTILACQSNFNVTFTDNTPGAASYVWDIDNWDPANNQHDWSNDYNTATFTHNYPNTGCFNVSEIVTDANGCIDTLVKDNYICIKEPIADFEIDTSRGCLPVMVAFTDKSFMDPNFLIGNEINEWHWEFGDGYAIEGKDTLMADSTNNCLTNCTYRDPTHTFKDTGIFTTMLIVTTKLGCKDTVTNIATDQCLNDIMDTNYCKVAVGIPPQVDFYAEDKMGCFPFSTKFHDMSSTYANGWTWDFGDGGNNSMKDPPYVYQNEPGEFAVQLIADMYTCADTLKKKNYITISVPKADFKITSDFFGQPSYNFCLGDSQLTGEWKITIKDTSAHADFWLYDFGDFYNPNLNAVDTFLMVQHDTLVIPAETILKSDTIFSYNAPDSSIINISCSQFYQLNIPADTLAIIQDTILPQLTIDTFFLGGTVIYGCDTIIVPSDTIIGYMDTIFMNGDVLFRIGMCNSSTIFNGDTVNIVPQISPEQIFLTTTPPDTIFSDTLWHNCKYLIPGIVLPITKTDTIRADTNYRPTPFSYTYTQPGQYSISLVTRNDLTGCVDSINRNLFICDIVPNFSMLSNDSGCAPYTNTFTDKTDYIGCDLSQPIIKKWDFDDGCIVAFNAADSNIQIDPLYVALCNNSISGLYKNPSKFYTSGGEYNVSLTTLSVPSTGNYCSDSIFKKVVVFDNPQPDFSADTLTGCSELEVHLTNDNYATQPNTLVKWVWTYINTGTNPAITTSQTTLVGPSDSNIFVVSNLPQDSFTVILQVTDQYGCEGTLTKPSFIVVTKPLAKMIFNNSWCNESLLSVYSNSNVTSPASYYWDFGDGTIDTTTFPVVNHQYSGNDADTFNITLVVSDVNGCLDDTTQQIVIYKPKADFYLDTTLYTFCPPLIAFFQDSSTSTDPIVKWTWDYGDGVVNTLFTNSSSHVYLDQGVYDVEMIIETQNGCRDTIQYDSLITVSGPKIIYLAYTDTFACDPPDYNPFSIELTLVVANTKWIKIDWNDGRIDSVILTNFDTTSLLFRHKYWNAGTFNPAIFIWDPVNPPPMDLSPCGKIFLPPIVIVGANIDFTTDDSTGGPRLVNFTNTSSNYTEIDHWLWNFGDPSSGILNSDTTFNAFHNYNNMGEYDVILLGYQIYESLGDTCIYSETKQNYVVLGINKPVQNNQITVYPNPASQILYLHFSVSHSDFSIYIYNIFGEEIAITNKLSGNQYTLNITSLSSGLYFLRLQTEGTTFLHRFAVSK